MSLQDIALPPLPPPTDHPDVLPPAEPPPPELPADVQPTAEPPPREFPAGSLMDHILHDPS
jgi:hypothetical protein